MAKWRKKKEGIDILEDPNAVVEKANEFFDSKKNRILVSIIGGILAITILGIAGYNYYITDQNMVAQEELFQSQFYFESDSLAQALNGDGNNYGFLDIIDKYPRTKAANLSHFYAGVSYLKLGDFNGAIRHLNEFSSSDYIVQARAYALTGDAYMEIDDFGRAAEYYERASDYKPNEYFTPVYLKKLAIAYENGGQPDAAAKAYGRIVHDFPNATEVHNAKKQCARLEAIASEN